MKTSTNKPDPQWRGRQLRAGTLWGIIFQVVYAFWQFAVLSILYPYLGVERFGLWVTIYSLTLWTTLGYFGIHQALLTHAGRFGPRTGGRRVDHITWLATFIAAAIGMAIILSLLTLGWFVPWSDLLNAPDPVAQSEAAPLAIVALCLSALTLPLAMSGVIALARQRADLRYTVASVVQLLDLVAVWLAVRAGWSLLALAVLMLAPPLMTGVILWVFMLRKRQLHPRIPKRTLGPRSCELWRTGQWFFILDLANLLVLQAGYLFVAHQVSLRSVTIYAATYRIVGLLLSCGSALSQAYWPTFAEACRERNTDWLKQGTRQMVLTTLLGWSAAVVVLVWLGPPFIEWWLEPEARPSVTIMLAALFFAGMQLLRTAIETPLKGYGRVRNLVIAAVCGGIAQIPLAILGTRYFDVAGMFAAQGLAVSLAVVVNASVLAYLIQNRPLRY